jgi:phage replication initiation protein
MKAQKTTVDWLRWRTQADVLPGLEALRALFGDLGPQVKLKHLGRGMDGFQQAAAVCLQDMLLGRVDFGGESQRGWVRWNLTGLGCQWVTDWDAATELEALSSAQLRRTDLALTTWRGEVSHSVFEKAHAAGRFNGGGGGRPPNMRLILNSDPRAGSTCEVGARKSDKLVRGYEKGFEMLTKLPRSIADATTHIEGFPVEGIYRTEVEFKAQTRDIPWDVIGRRDEYFAGSYPFCADILPGVDADILQRRPERAPQTDLRAALGYVRDMWGSTLFTALAAAQGDIGAVWAQIVGKDHNKALLAGGVLVVDHPWLTDEAIA